MLSFAIQAFEDIRAWLILFHFNSRWVNFEICLVALGKVTIMFDLMRTIVFDASWSLYSVYKSNVSLLLAILVLKNTRVHVCVLNSNNIAFYVEIPINKILSFTTTLDISYIQPNNGHIWHRWYFDNLKLWSK